MNKRLTLLLLPALLLACTPAASPTPGLPQASPDEPFVASPGSQFQVAIAGNLTTGYTWELIGGLEEGVVELLEESYQPSASADDMLVGSGGTHLWTFRVSAPGETKLVFGQYPPSNEPGDPEQVLTFIIIVK